MQQRGACKESRWVWALLLAEPNEASQAHVGKLARPVGEYSGRRIAAAFLYILDTTYQHSAMQ